MPELPEVETVVRTLAPQITGRAIVQVSVLLPKTLAAGADLLPALVPGAVVTSVWRRAKLVVVDLAAPDTPRDSRPEYVLLFHLKMTGRLFVHPEDTVPHKHTRMVFDLGPQAGHPPVRLFFDDARTFGYCRLMRRDDLAVWPFWAALGPEPLTLKPADFSKALGTRKAAVKALLLDQTVIAGIGNIYADEACFCARIHPATPGAALNGRQRSRLLSCLKKVLEASIRECGSSIRDYRTANGDAGAFQNRFQVYGRAGQPCLVCGANLAKTVVAGRTTVFCPRCQPLSGV